MNIKQILALLLSISLMVMIFTSCSKKDSTDTTTTTKAQTDTSGMDLEFTDRDKDPSYDESKATTINLSARTKGDIVTISKEGTYILTGTLSEGQVVVSAADTDKIQIVLRDANITCTTNAPIYVKSADKVFITLDANSSNTLTDGAKYDLEDEENINAVIYSKSDLTLNGTGTLTINGNYNHGIFSKDDLVITDGVYNITCEGDGLKGKDCIKILTGTFTVAAGKDAMQSSETEDATKGFIYICDGTYNLNAAFDGIQAETLLKISKGTFNIVTGGGSANASTTKKGDMNQGWGKWNMGTTKTTETTETTSDSAKGLKCTGAMLLEGGKITVDSSDDAVHSNGNITISAGTYTLTSGDDGIHADNVLTVAGGTVNVTKSYEGLEGLNVVITGGTTSIVASDDGINAAGGSDTAQEGRPGANSFATDTTSNYLLKITGGYLFVNASGDGLDSNGDIEMTGGTVVVSGPASDGNGPLDAGDNNNTIKVTGGLLLAVGSTGMLDLPEDNYIYSTSLSSKAEQVVAVEDSSGKLLVAFKLPKQAQGIIFSYNGTDGDYVMKTGVTYSGTFDVNGVATSGSITGGTTVTEGGAVGGNMGGGNMGGGMQRPNGGPQMK